MAGLTSRLRSDAGGSDNNLREYRDQGEKDDLENYRLRDKLKSVKHALATPPQFKPTAKFTNTRRGAIADTDRDSETPEIRIDESMRYNPNLTEVMAHEVGHRGYGYAGNPHSADPRDLMFAVMDPNKEAIKEPLAKKIRRRALENLNAQEKEILPRQSAFDRATGEPYPIPVEEMYSNIEKNVPADKKYYWWGK